MANRRRWDEKTPVGSGGGGGVGGGGAAV